MSFKRKLEVLDRLREDALVLKSIRFEDETFPPTVSETAPGDVPQNSTQNNLVAE